MPTDVLGRLLKMLRDIQARIAARRPRSGRRQTKASTTGSRPASESFRRLRRGEISLTAYLEEKVEQALIPLEALLHESDVRLVQSIVREKLETDPVLSALVARIARRISAPAR
jgi:hypothetical protein